MSRGSACLAVVVVFTGLLWGCASSGLLHGKLLIPERPAADVTFNFKSDLAGGGTLTTVLPDGESFSGKYVQITSSTSRYLLEPMFRDWTPYWSDWGPFGPYAWNRGEDFETFRTNYSGKVVATLVGDKGTAMRCRFRLSDPPVGLSGGGLGECQLSTGGRIDVQF